MPKGNKVRVLKAKNGQYRVTIPRAIGEAMDLQGALVEVSIGGKDTIIIKVLERDKKVLGDR